MKKKITYIIWRNNPGGIEILIPSLIEHFGKENSSVFILRSKQNSGTDVFESVDVKKYFGSNNNLIMLIKLFKYTINNKNNIFHLFNVGPLVLLLLKLAHAKNIVYHIRGTIYWKNKFNKFYLKILWKLALWGNAIFLANSEWSKQRFIDQVSKTQAIKVIYNPIDPNKFNYIKRNDIRIPKNIMYAGRLTKGKNLYKWVDMADFLLKHNYKLNFNIYGDGPLKKNLINYIALKGLAHKIIIKGYIKDMESAYHKNDLFIFLSEYESFGNVVVESILCGTPVIANRIPSMEEIFEDNLDFIIDINNNFEESILKMFQNYPVLLSKTNTLAQEFKLKFSYSDHFSMLNNIYEQFNK